MVEVSDLTSSLDSKEPTNSLKAACWSRLFNPDAGSPFDGVFQVKADQYVRY